MECKPYTEHAVTGYCVDIVFPSADNRLADPTPDNESPKEVAAVRPKSADEVKSK